MMNKEFSKTHLSRIKRNGIDGDLHNIGESEIDIPVRVGSFSIGSFLQTVLFSWGLFGHNFMVLLAVQLQLPTRELTILARGGLAALSLLTMLAMFLRAEHFNRRRPAVLVFVGFWIVYIIRLVFESNSTMAGIANGNQYSHEYIVQMAIGSCLIPSIAILTNTCWSWNRAALIFSSLLSVVTAAFMMRSYSSRIVNFEGRWRPGTEIGGYEAIHPLALGYMGASLVALAIYFICIRRGGLAKRVITGAVLGSLGVPLLVGSASRGPMVSLAFCAGFIFVALIGSKAIGRGLTLVIFCLAALVSALVFAEKSGSSVFDRIMNIPGDIDADAESAVRLDLYEMAVDSFLENPFFGTRLTLPGDDTYPHNLFLESLMSTGLIGTGLLVALALFALSSSWWIVVLRADLSWIPMLFVLYFASSMYSHAIYTNVAMWVSLAATLSAYEWVKRENSIEIVDSVEEDEEEVFI